MDGSPTLPTRGQQRFVDESVAEPAFLVVVGFGQRHGLAHKPPEGIALRQRLTVELVYPLRRPVGRDHHEWHALIAGLSHGGHEIEQRRARGDAHGHGTGRGQCHAQRIEACRPLVDYVATLDVRADDEVVRDGCIPAARTHHGMPYAMGYEQRRQDVHIFFIAIHGLWIYELTIYGLTILQPWKVIITINCHFSIIERMVIILASVSCHSCSSTLSFSRPPPA